jgi:hypothetical protein
MAVLYLANASVAAPFVFNLPAATGSGLVIVIKKMDSNAQNIAVTPNGTDTIDGVNAAVNITIQYDDITVCDIGTGAWAKI